MAKQGEGDARWVVQDRADGANCNNWHWTTTDASSNLKKALCAAAKAVVFPPDGLLENCRVKSAEATGEASINNRKGRTFLIYELQVKCKWSGELHDGETGACLEKGSGSLNFTDVSAESLDDLDVEFTTSARGSALSEAMRKQGVLCIKQAVVRCITDLQAEVSAGAKIAASANRVTPAVSAPLPQPISVGPAPAPGSADLPSAYAKKVATKVRAVASDSDSDGGKGDDDDDEPPKAMVEALRKLKANPAKTTRLRLSNLGLGDHHLKALVSALQHSEVSLEELDLTFNRLTDQGVHLLVKALHGGVCLELARLYLGGNRTSPAGMALSQHIKQARADILVDWKPQLPHGKSMCTVGTVYPASPANRAGLQTGDSIVAFGAVQGEEYKGVSESIVPIVKASIKKEIRVVVVRLDGMVSHVQLVLTPQSWSGAGLLGCILK